MRGSRPSFGPPTSPTPAILTGAAKECPAPRPDRIAAASSAMGAYPPGHRGQVHGAVRPPVDGQREGVERLGGIPNGGGESERHPGVDEQKKRAGRSEPPVLPGQEGGGYVCDPMAFEERLEQEAAFGGPGGCRSLSPERDDRRSGAYGNNQTCQHVPAIYASPGNERVGDAGPRPGRERRAARRPWYNQGTWPSTSTSPMWRVWPGWT